MPKIGFRYDCPVCGYRNIKNPYHVSPVYKRERIEGSKNGKWRRLNGVFFCDKCFSIYIFPEAYGSVETINKGGDDVIVVKVMTREEYQKRSDAKIKRLTEEAVMLSR